MLNLEELAQEAKGGNKAAMELLLRQTYQDIFRLIHWKTRNYHLAWDLTQETYVKLLKQVHKYDPAIGDFKPWLIRVALNTVADYYRSKAYKQSEQTDTLETEVEDSGDLLEGVLTREETRRFVSAVNTLPQGQREVLLLKFMQGLKFNEIAEALFINEATAKSRARLGLLKLRDLLGGGEGSGSQTKRSTRG